MNVKEALTNLKEFEEHSTEAVEHVGEMFEHLKMIGEAALVFLAVEKLKEFGEEAIKLAADQEAVQHRLNTAMQLAGGYTEEAAAGMRDFAEELQGASTFSEDAITSQLAYAKGIGLSDEQSKKLVETSANLAASLGTDLETQVSKLGRTFSGSIGRMGQTIPALKQFSEEQLKAGAAVDYLAEHLDGAAEAAVHTYAGATQQAAFAQEDFLKTIGHFVTDSPIMVARIEAMTQTWKDAREWVVENKEQIQEFVDLGITAIVNATPAAVDTLGILAVGFEYLTEGAALATAELINIVGLIALAFSDTIGEIISDVLDFVAEIGSLIESVPGATEALDAIGISSDGLSSSVTDLRKGFDAARFGVVNAADDMQDAIFGFVDKSQTKFGKFNEMMDGLSLKVHTGAQAILDADVRIGESGKESGEARDTANKLSQKEIDNLIKELGKLDQALFNQTANDVEKAVAEYDGFEEEIAKLRDAGIISKDEAHDRDLLAEQAYVAKLAKIDEGAVAPVKSVIETGLEAGLMAAFSSTGNGAASAKSFFTGAANAAVTAYTGSSQLGSFVSNILGLLLGDPKATQAWVKSFIDAVPEMIDNMGENIPIICETIIEEVLSTKFWERAANTFMRAVVWEGMWKSSGRLFGVEVGDAFNGNKIGATISGGWHKDMAWWRESGFKIGQDAGHNFMSGINTFFERTQASGDKIKAGFQEAPAHIAQGFHDGVDYFTGHVADSFGKGAGAVFGAIEKGGKDLFDGLGKPFAAAGKQFIDALGDAFPKFSMPHFEWPHLDVPAWVGDFRSAVDKLAGLSGVAGVGGGGGGGGGFAGTVAKAVDPRNIGKHAKGLDLVPAGFTGDSYLAGLTEKEGVLDGETNTDIRKMGKAFAEGGMNRDVCILLAQLVQVMSQPVTTQSTIKIDGRAFADLQLKQSRLNQRTSA